VSIAEAGGKALAPPVPTPCINVCRLDEATGLCLGCARNGAEIAVWAEADAEFKRRVWEVLPPRRAQAGLSVWRLPWTAGEIAAFMEAVLRDSSGRWVLGAYGASIGFEIGAGEKARIESTADAVTAVTSRGALRLLKHEKAIAIASGRAADPLGPESIGLVLPRGRVSLRQGGRPDEDAIIEAHSRNTLIQVELAGSLSVRLHLRFNHLDASAQSEGAVADGSLHAVVETGLGRAEIFKSEGDGDGPVFVLNARHAAEAVELPPPWTLDPIFALGALFYPHRRTSGPG
jgi:predicted Fe-S protein YdhL (DUF1289 family)